MWNSVAKLVEALHCITEGRGFDSRWGHRHNPSGRTVVGSVSNRNEYQEYFLRGKGGELATFMCQLSLNFEASTSWDPQCLSRLVTEIVLIYLTEKISFSSRRTPFAFASRHECSYTIHQNTTTAFLPNP